MKINETRIKAGNKIIKTTVEELPLYRINKTQASYLWEDGEFEDYLIYKQIITYSPQYKWLNNTSFTSDSRNANEVLELFTKYINEKHKDYKVYVLQEYRHSGSCFHLTETTDRIDRWDSGIVGFMALPTNENKDTIANMITDVYEGTIDLIEIIDNETEEQVDSYEYWLNTDRIEKYKKIQKDIKDNYDIDMD